MLSTSRPTAEARRLGALLDAAAEAIRCDSRALRRTAASMLAIPSVDEARAGISSLNHDGSPLEICLTARESSREWRLIADPGFDRLLPGARLLEAKGALGRLIDEGKAEALTGAIDRLLDASLAAPPLAAFPSGVFWLAGAIGRPGIGIYVDAAPQRDGWELARGLVPGPEATSVVRALEPLADVSSFGIEGTTLEDARYKIYFRLREPAALSAWGDPAFSDPRYLHFLTLLLRDADVRREGIVASIGFALATGARADSKIDVCGHCLPWDSTTWREILASAGSSFALDLRRVDPLLERTAVAFVGLGINAAGKTRLNVYFKPRDEDVAADRIERAAVRAAWRLLRARGADGSWTDYELPVGASDQWVTAYAGHALAIAGRSMADARAAALDAAEWLERSRTYEAGWGFNGHTGPDADSTAFALALRRELALPIAERDLAFLRACRRGGGFATYPRDDAWGLPHPDVTPLAFLAFPPEERRAWEEEVIAFLRRSRLATGGWPSYWWRSSSYAGWAVGELLARLGRLDEFSAPPLAPDRASAFDLACAIGAAAAWGEAEAARAWVEDLLALEAPGGGFAGEEQLRVVDDGDPAPWSHDRARYYRDGRGTIVNATVVRALAALSNS